MNFNEWGARYPQAAADLMTVLDPGLTPPESKAETAEARAQQRARFHISQQGAFSWRNNVGATPAKIPTYCPRCNTGFNIEQQPTRYGLANDSAKLNKKIKSSDLILAIPRVITPEMVGTTMAQFGSVEVKPDGWEYTGDEHEAGQAAWLSLVQRIGGFSCFSTGEVKL